jgi:para-nitrobenzyl esterase
MANIKAPSDSVTVKLNTLEGRLTIRKKESSSIGYCGKQLIIVVIIAFILLASSGYFNAVPALAPGQAKAVDSMRPDRETTEGVVIGTLNRMTNTFPWKGIPYAKRPVGDLRWKTPQDAEKHSAPLRASNFCEICPQYTDHDGNPATPQVIQGNEDCLYLNIWRPRSKAADFPGYFWIHGGGNSTQWPLLSDTDASILANRSNLVVVTVNYRLGPMGFFSHPALRTGKSGDEKTDSGNFGLLDLIRALSWVKANIKAFGGDPENVTIAGQSAGAQNVISLLASPLAKNLFHRAVSQSGVIRPSTPSQGAEHANVVITKLLVKDGSAPEEKTAAAKLKGMSLMEIRNYLRSKRAQDFLEMYPEGKLVGLIRFANSFGDGAVLPFDFYGALKAGAYNKVPIILGTNKEEMKLFQMFDPRFAPWIKDGSLFKDPDKTELYDLVAQYQSDGWRAMGLDQLARIMGSVPDQPMILAYQFLWGAGGMKKSVTPFPINQTVGAGHTLEIDLVFGTEAVSLGGWAFGEKNRPGRVALFNAMMDYMAQFARTGNPNREGSGLPEWKPWSNTEGSPKTLLLDADFNNLKIEMSRKELTEADIEEALKKEPRVKGIQPFWDTSRYRSSIR